MLTQYAGFNILVALKGLSLLGAAILEISGGQSQLIFYLCKMKTIQIGIEIEWDGFLLHEYKKSLYDIPLQTRLLIPNLLHKKRTK